jgi:hypothetical protein
MSWLATTRQKLPRTRFTSKRYKGAIDASKSCINSDKFGVASGGKRTAHTR